MSHFRCRLSSSVGLFLFILLGMVVPSQAEKPASTPSTTPAQQASLDGGKSRIDPAIGSFIIRLGARGIEPSDIVVRSEATIVWRNQTGSEVRIEFLGRGPAVTCNEPVGFELSPEGLSKSERLHVGDVASVCIVEPKEYRYQVIDLKSSTKLGQGSIKVTRTY